MTTEAGKDDQWTKIMKAVDELDEIRDNYFPNNPDDKVAKMVSQVVLILELLDSVPLEERNIPAHRAINEYVTGKIFNLIPEYSEKAEYHFSKAVILNPSFVVAWLSLGKCIWKKGDLPVAKNCFTHALKEGPEKQILCQLSMLTIKMAQGAENQAELIEESIQYARKAITLDVNYGISWYYLGNSYLTSFFYTGAVNRNKLTQSFKAYQNALKDKRLVSNPDLYYKLATAHRYLEDFERALIGFEGAVAAAALWNPGHKASEAIQDLTKLLDKLNKGLKGHARVKSFEPYITYANPNTSYRRVTIGNLSKGSNKGVAVLGTVLSFIIHEMVLPMYYAICDSDNEFFALSLFKIQYDMIKIGDQLILEEPFYHNYDFSWNKKKYEFKLIRLDDLNQLIVNGNNLF